MTGIKPVPARDAVAISGSHEVTFVAAFRFARVVRHDFRSHLQNTSPTVELDRNLAPLDRDRAAPLDQRAARLWQGLAPTRRPRLDLQEVHRIRRRGGGLK